MACPVAPLGAAGSHGRAGCHACLPGRHTAKPRVWPACSYLRSTGDYDARVRARLTIAALLLCSGMCALIYQVAWLRELRLVFGASTPASAAVLAVFMGGLGVGSLVLGKRADQKRRPLLLYATLEGGITLTAAVTPLLLLGVRAAYVGLGGTTTLGAFLGTVVRLLLSAVVLLAPTFLMGGTLPAAARAAMPRGDTARRSTALLYGANTIGAVVGAALSTFILLEVFGTRFTLWLGCGVNALVAVLARVLDRRLAAAATGANDEAAAQDTRNEPEPPVPGAEKADRSKAAADASIPATAAGRTAQPAATRSIFVLVAAAAVGFVFLLMELVWYRMLAPLLGGSTYTFGLILSVALLGIGIGGLVYALRAGARTPHLAGFAGTCALEAVLLAIPYALGDRVALAALLLRTFRAFGLLGHALAWSIITALVVLPAAIVAGYQFPLLISLLGRGGHRVGRHVGAAYASNTAGAIAGSLAGGFVLLPALTAPGAWQLSVWLLALLAIIALALEQRKRPRGRSWLLGASAAALGALCALALIHGSLGPTAAWRHSPIGAGRADDQLPGATINRLQRFQHEQRLAVTWQVDGRESSLALYALNDAAFVMSGKSDGAALEDSGTQVMSGLLGAMLHPQVERVLVIGLGTGSTAGWLAAVPSVTAVDVVEIEPAIVEVARVCSLVNLDVLDNPKVNLIIGDAREVLLTTRHRYDLIFSEPSNPYRAGIASLFTQEFYQAVQDRLNPDGVFVQWVQAYEIDATAVRTVYRTLSDVFPSIETWRTDVTDLVLLSRKQDRPVDIAELSERIAEEPFKSGLMAAWRASRVEDVLARYVAQPSLARAVAEQAGPWAINTDDRNLLEFGVARSLGRSQLFRVEDVMDAARARHEPRPPLADPSVPVDWDRVDDAYVMLGMAGTATPRPLAPRGDSEQLEQRYKAVLAWTRNNPQAAVRAWSAQPREPSLPVELMVMADSFASLGDEDATAHLMAQLRAHQPTEALAIEARLRWAQNLPELALPALEAALAAYHADPWPNMLLMSRLLPLAEALAEYDAGLAPRLFESLGPSLGVHALRHQRQRTRFRVALWAANPRLCVEALEPFEPHIPWEREHLQQRARCYSRANHPRSRQALADLERFIERAGSRGKSLLPVPPTGEAAAR